MMDVEIILARTGFSINSLTALAGAIECTPETVDVPMQTVRVKRLSPSEIVDCFSADTHTIVAISFTTVHIIAIARLVRDLRAELVARGREKVTIVGGGPHPSGSPDEALAIGFDYVVRGEGEIAFPAMVSAIREGRDPSAIQGVFCMRDGVCVGEGFAERPNLDDFLPIAPGIGLTAAIEITRGCPEACHFCQTSFLFGPKYRHRSVESLEKVAAYATEKERLEMRFVSPNSLSYAGGDLGVIEEMLVRIRNIDPRIKTYLGSFPSEVWPASVSNRALDMIRKLCYNDNIVVGVQTGSQRLLDQLHRGHTVEQAVEAVRLILKHGFQAYVDFVFGFPNETQEDQLATIELVKRVADMGAIVHSHAFMPLVGTPYADQPPRDLPDDIVSVLDRLSGQARQFGMWRSQLKRNREVVEFRRKLSEAGLGAALAGPGNQ